LEFVVVAKTERNCSKRNVMWKDRIVDEKNAYDMLAVLEMSGAPDILFKEVRNTQSITRHTMIDLKTINAVLG
jgi:hypothetical protein